MRMFQKITDSEPFPYLCKTPTDVTGIDPKSTFVHDKNSHIDYSFYH